MVFRFFGFSAGPGPGGPDRLGRRRFFGFHVSLLATCRYLLLGGGCICAVTPTRVRTQGPTHVRTQGLGADVWHPDLGSRHGLRVGAWGRGEN